MNYRTTHTSSQVSASRIHLINCKLMILAESQTDLYNKQMNQLMAIVEELKLTRSSSTEVAAYAEKYLRVNEHEACKNISTATYEGTFDLQVPEDFRQKHNEAALLALIVKHFQHNDTSLCIIDTQKKPIFCMNKIPDVVFVQRSSSTNVASSIVGVMKITLGNMIAARGRVVYDIMELRKAQPNRKEFYAFISNTFACILFKFVFNDLGQQFVNIYQTRSLDWKEGT